LCGVKPPRRDRAGQQSWKPIFLLVALLATGLAAGLFLLARSLLGGVIEL